MRQSGWRLVVKRGLDVSVAAGLLTATLPLAAAAAALIAIDLGRPVLFRQRRPGLSGRPFTIYKFRTMRRGKGSDAERLSRIGKWLRMASVDELPQLWNVLSGEMSLVGPRPLLMEYLERYDARQARRHEVLPGITGWAQVNGRNALTHEQRFELDVWYVENWTLSLDLRILGLTIARALSGRGVNAEGHATMPEFMGNAGGAPTKPDGPVTGKNQPC